MIREFRVTNIYVAPENWQRMDLLCMEFGWHKKTIVRRCIHGFFQRHQGFYAEAALKDAKLRGISEKEYFLILRDKTIDDLPPYPKDTVLPFGISPLMQYPLVPTEPEFRHPYNMLTLSAYNYVLFRTALIVERLPQNQVIGKMIVKHFADDWPIYEARMQRDRACKFAITN
ncbi:MAG: hypothetical protein HC805_03665 [Alkalinema sp. RL_2_19]|nr:hypothetical protein [Alkalinema sp. RL_2_19]